MEVLKGQITFSWTQWKFAFLTFYKRGCISLHFVYSKLFHCKCLCAKLSTSLLAFAFLLLLRSKLVTSFSSPWRICRLTYKIEQYLRTSSVALQLPPSWTKEMLLVTHVRPMHWCFYLLLTAGLDCSSKFRIFSAYDCVLERTMPLPIIWSVSWLRRRFRLFACFQPCIWVRTCRVRFLSSFQFCLCLIW